MDVGRRRWKKVPGYHRQSRVENAFFRYTSIIGGSLRARASGGQAAEVLLVCNVLNQTTDLGRPASYGIGRYRPSELGAVRASSYCCTNASCSFGRHDG